jgi:hypothetical protein
VSNVLATPVTNIMATKNGTAARMAMMDGKWWVLNDTVTVDESCLVCLGWFGGMKEMLMVSYN